MKGAEFEFTILSKNISGGDILNFFKNNKSGSEKNSFIFKSVMNEYYTGIYNFCLMRLNNEMDAEECADDVFVVLYLKLHVLRFDTNIKSWLYKVADNKIKEYRRKIKKHNDNIIDIDVYNIIDDESDFYDKLTDSVTDALLNSDILKESEKDIINDYFINGFTAEEMARKYGITTNAVYIRIMRVREKVSKYIRETQQQSQL